MKSCYHALTNETVAREPGIWGKIWKINCPQRIRSFLWLCVHGKLLTNVERARRSLAQHVDCERCGTLEESLLHVLRDCPKARDTWMRLVQPGKWHEFFLSFGGRRLV